MKIFILAQSDYNGREIQGVFTSNEKAQAMLDKGYWNGNDGYEIREFETDLEVPNKFALYYEHEISPLKDYGVRELKPNHDYETTSPNELVWSNENGLQARGLGATPEEATRRVHELLAEYKNLPARKGYLPAITNPRPDLIIRQTS